MTVLTGDIINNKIILLMPKRTRAFRRERQKASRTLGDNVYNAKKNKSVKKESWWKGREAQHLIPFSIGWDLGIPVNLLNSSNNGTMLPSGRVRAKPVSDYINKKKFIRISHIEPGTGLDHKMYSLTIFDYLNWLKQNRVDLIKNFNRITYVIRLATKLKSKDAKSSTGYVNYIKLSTLKNLYNSKDAIIQEQYQKVSQYGHDGMLKYNW